MDKTEYTIITQQILMLANLIKDVELGEYIQMIDRSDATGPILDPTLWRKAHEKTAILKRMAEGLQKFQQSLPTEEEAKKADMTQKFWEEYA